MRQPMVSVIIPVYNGSDFLTEAVDSILQQTYSNYEIIVVNDGSDDNGKTRDVALAYGNRIRYIEKENGGVASALNDGIRIMRGSYFAWLSHDDTFCSTKIESQMEAIFSSGNEMTICAGNYCLCDENLAQCITTDFQKHFPMSYLKQPLFLLLWGELHFSSLLFHRKHFERVGLFDESLLTAQDNDFIFRLMRGQKITFVETSVSRVRLHSLSGTSQYHKLVDTENCKLYASMIKDLSDEEIQRIAPKPYMVYGKIGGLLKSMGGEKELSLVEKQAEERGAEWSDLKERTCLKERPMAIFGAGEYGLRLKYELNLRQIEPVCFLDNNPEKAGTVIDGIPCYEISHLKEHSEYMAVIAQKFYASAWEQLQRIGHSHVMLKQEVDSLLLQEA